MVTGPLSDIYHKIAYFAHLKQYMFWYYASELHKNENVG